MHCAAALCAGADPRVLEWEGRTMGTFYSVKIAGVEPDERRTAELRAAVERRFDEINLHVSHYRPDSELSRFNACTSLQPFKVSAELALLARRAIELSEDSSGAFDPTLGWLIDLWGFGPAGTVAQPPTDVEIAAAHGKCGASHLRVTAQNELQKNIPALRLNLSAIAKGYASDEAARLLEKRGYSNVFVSVCGEIAARGVNADNKPWRVGVESPSYDNQARGGRLSAVVAISNRALSTSGDAHKFFTDANGQVYSHVLDPATGRPVRHTLASVTVIAPDAMTADGLSTTLFVLGLEDGLQWIDARPQYAALFIVREGPDRFKVVPSRRFPVFQTENP